MSEVEKFKCIGYMVGRSRVGGAEYVFLSDFDRVTAERDAALGREAELREELDEALRVLGFSGNEADAYSTAALHDELTSANSDKEAYAQNAIDLRKRVDALQQRLTAADEELDQCQSMAQMIEEKEWAEHVGKGPISSQVESAFTQLHNELSEARQGLTAADERADVLEWLLLEVEAACDLAMSAIDDDERGANFVQIIATIKAKAVLKRSDELVAQHAAIDFFDAALKPTEGGGDES